MLTVEHEAILDNAIINTLNDEIKAQEEYILEHEDFADGYSHVLLGDNFIYHAQLIKNRLNFLLGTELTDNEYEHLTEWIDTREIEIVIAVEPDIMDNDFDLLYNHPIGEVETPFSDIGKKLLDALKPEELEYVIDHLEAYVREDSPYRFYQSFGNVSVQLWINTEQLYAELQTYRNL